MKTSRIIVLFLALAAAAGAFVLMNSSKPPPPEPVAVAPAAPPPTEDVLVAAKDVPLGHKIGDGDLAWQAWPKDALPPGSIHRLESPKALEEDKGAIARTAMYQGEPIRAEKLIKGVNNGFMSAMLPSGKRAVAINIDSQGATTAGSFILPNDRVDVLRTFKVDSKGSGLPGGEPFTTETLLSNVKVLAIGQNFQDKDGQPVVVGSNATLELDPAQAEIVILAQRTGQLSLVLRSMLDARQAGEAVRKAAHSLSVVRYGTVSEDLGR